MILSKWKPNIADLRHCLAITVTRKEEDMKDKDDAEIQTNLSKLIDSKTHAMSPAKACYDIPRTQGCTDIKS